MADAEPTNPWSTATSETPAASPWDNSESQAQPVTNPWGTGIDNDISAQNLRMRDGEASAKDIERHANAWIRANQAKFDGWIAEAMKAAK